MKGAEFALWGEYREKFGFDTDRLEWAVLNSGSAICYAQGAKTKAEDLQPKFGRRRQGKRKMLSMLATMPGTTVMFIPNDPNRLTVTGPAALDELDRIEEMKAARPKTLDQKPNDKTKRPKTLGGD